MAFRLSRICKCSLLTYHMEGVQFKPPRFKVKISYGIKFKTVFSRRRGLTICGKSSAFGTRLSKSCGMEFKVREIIQSQDCNNAEATVLEGVFFVE